jgi:hypothetical protein
MLVVISCGAEIIAGHPRFYEREDLVFNPLHYLPCPPPLRSGMTPEVLCSEKVRQASI